MTTAVGATAALSAAVIDGVAHGGDLTGLVTGIGALAVAVLVFGLVRRRPVAIPWSILLTAAVYLVGREGNPAVDGGAAIVGALLLLSAELASWSIEHDSRIEAERTLVVWRAGVIAALVAGALLVNFLLLGAAALTASSGLVVAVAGTIAAVSAVAIVLRLVRS